MGGVNIQDDVIIDKSIKRSLDSRASVVKRYVADIGKSWPVLIVCGGLVPLFQSRCLAASYSAFCCCHAMDNRCPFQHAFNIGADSCPWSRHSDDFYLSYSYPHFSCHHPPYVLSWQHQSSRRSASADYIPAIPYATTLTSLYSICSGYRRLSIYSVLVSYSIRYAPFITIAIFFHLFGCYWDTQFFTASSATVITGSAASYYYNRCRLLDEFFSSHHCSRVVAVEIERSHLYFSEDKVCSSGKTFKG
ncbi:hypothetical protein F2Q70_00037282 [Brassica cretica]|uniref:Choline transporter-like protein n=1 Tax=Brassica cretica TaxID=69181 RepID=A0A3N6S353_BRACR|nr:hypothetical protein F2Q70_00037282 [Brassica cretica]KAF3531823.1 hypothetical protein DY000_02042976 [Brassica cretica]